MAGRPRETTLLPETISRRRLPVNCDPQDLELFEDELERLIPSTTLREFEDVSLSSDGYLFRRHRILPESFANPAIWTQWKWRSLVKFFVSNYALRRSRAIDRDVLWITDDWSSAYFHWLTDALGRLYVMRDRLDDYLLLLPCGYESLDFVHGSLKAFGARSVAFIGRDEVLRCRRLVMPTLTAPSGHYNEQVIGAVQRLLRQADDGSHAPQGMERLYISRRGARKRRILNEENVMDVLARKGFHTIRAEDYSFEQQQRMCSRARYLVSNHGAGLTNMLFMDRGASVLELRHHADRINNCYFTLASALGLKYFYQTCQASGPDPHVADLVVDTEKLSENVDLLLDQ